MQTKHKNAKPILNSSTENKITTQYTGKECTALDELKKLDRKVKRPVHVFSCAVGTISVLIMGTGMSLIMTDIGTTLGMAEVMKPGIVIGVVGMAMAIANYPVYKAMLGSRRKKYADKVIALSEKIMDK